MSAQALRGVGGHDAALDALAQYATDPVAANAAWGDIWAQWWRALPGTAKGDEPWNPGASGTGWRDAPRALISYQQWGVPELSSFVGMLWYRTTVKLTAAQAAQDATLLLGNVDEIDQTWINGRGVGSSYGGAPRSYPLPRGLLRAGDNLVTVNALNTYIDGGLVGPAETRALRFADGSTVPLDAGGWQYRQVPQQAGTPPLAPWLSASGRTTLYNGMIAPLGAYALRGALWYQGESNVGDARDYQRLLAAYREDLRRQFGAQLPLLIVQRPNYGAVPVRPAPRHGPARRRSRRGFVR
jgi:sialate O-acetylesterase